MISQENKFLVKYLFPNADCLIFFKEQLFDELKQVIPEKLCYSKNNQDFNTRTLNKNECLYLISLFFNKNEIYKKEIEALYKKNIDETIEDILGGFVFILKKGLNVLEDNKSVCFVEGITLHSLK